MRDADAVLGLLARIERTRGILERIAREYSGFVEGDLRLLGRKNTTAIVVAELMVDYYTCAETLFLRISQFFRELMRFRHFWRYYFEPEYDWEKLGYLQGVFARVTARLPSDLASFAGFLEGLLGGAPGPVARSAASA